MDVTYDAHDDTYLISDYGGEFIVMSEDDARLFHQWLSKRYGPA